MPHSRLYIVLHGLELGYVHTYAMSWAIMLSCWVCEIELGNKLGPLK